MCPACARSFHPSSLIFTAVRCLFLHVIRRRTGSETQGRTQGRLPQWQAGGSSSSERPMSVSLGQPLFPSGCHVVARCLQAVCSFQPQKCGGQCYAAIDKSYTRCPGLRGVGAIPELHGTEAPAGHAPPLKEPDAASPACAVLHGSLSTAKPHRHPNQQSSPHFILNV